MNPYHRSVERVLAIETSCDDTSVAIVGRNGFVEQLLSADQDLVHAPFGGVVPEIASRNHSLQLLPLVELALERASYTWSDIGGIAVTARPGLVGSLLVGVTTAKALAMAADIPLIGVNHLEGHILAPFLSDKDYKPPENFEKGPWIALAVSGGHSHLYLVNEVGSYTVLGRTKDDAAGEAFDKFAKMLGLGFPGGAFVDRLAKGGNKKAFSFPRPLIHEDNLNFSFSGLKASALRTLATLNQPHSEQTKADLCASYQEAIVECLWAKLEKAALRYKVKKLLITGGVSANSRLRGFSYEKASQSGFEILSPPLRYCTDNAAMVGYAGILRLNKGEESDLALKPLAHSLNEDFKVI